MDRRPRNRNGRPVDPARFVVVDDAVTRVVWSR
jgi:hypothetical protein